MEEEPVDRSQHFSDAVRTLAFVFFFSFLSRVSYFELTSFSPLGIQLTKNPYTRGQYREGYVQRGTEIFKFEGYTTTILIIATYFDNATNFDNNFVGILTIDTYFNKSYLF